LNGKKINNTEKYKTMLQELHKIIEIKQKILNNLKDKNDEKLGIIHKIQHSEPAKTGEKIDIHQDTDIEEYLNQKSIMKPGQLNTEEKESPKEILKDNYNKANKLSDKDINSLNEIDTKIILYNNTGMVNYGNIDVIDIIDIDKVETVDNIPTKPQNKNKRKTEKNKARPTTTRKSVRSNTSISSKEDSEAQENSTKETYIIKPIKTDVDNQANSIVKILDMITKEDVQGLLKKRKNSDSKPSIISGLSSGRESNSSFLTADDGLNDKKYEEFSGNESNSGKTIQHAKRRLSNDSVSIPSVGTRMDSINVSPVGSARDE